MRLQLIRFLKTYFRYKDMHFCISFFVFNKVFYYLCKKKDMAVIGIDFDNTISTHNYPFTGDLIPYAKEVISLLHKNGHTIVLWTVRGNDKINELGMRDPKGTMSALENAKEFCERNGVIIDYYNISPIHPSSSPKQWTHYLIDDTALGCPMTFYHGHRVVDWRKIAELMVENNLLTKNDVDTLEK